ncbi:DMT family transporter [Sulfurospirillum arcachonense]|uniref:DMT family transporter n=1 Tax=Sulfurospirillum arcachonense TaxID=57666 RepID=UPI000469B22A|nr:DMT family transporter [Sulfurospirillum arcachonense]
MMLKLKSYAVPFVFIVLSGAGFVFIKMGLAYSSSMAFLELRYVLAFVVLLLVALIFRVKFPKSLNEIFHISVAGILSVGLFSIGCFNAIEYGLSPALCSLIVSLQPIIISFFAMKFLDESVSLKAWFGLILGLVGVGLVLGLNGEINNNELIGFLFAMLGLFSMSFGNLYQKKYCSNMNLITGGVIQIFASAIVVLPLLYFEDVRVSFNSEFIVALSYMSVVASIGVMSLLYYMIRHGEVSKVSSLFYLLPVASAVIAYFILNKDIELNVFIGIGIVLIAMNLINKKQQVQVVLKK